VLDWSKKEIMKITEVAKQLFRRLKYKSLKSKGESFERKGKSDLRKNGIVEEVSSTEK